MSSEKVLIIGGGIAGINLSWELKKRSVDFDIVDVESPHSATRVAVGLYNPVVLKRNSLVWESNAAWKLLDNYREIEDYLNIKFIDEEPFYKKLHTQEEYNNWQLLESDSRFTNMVSFSQAKSCGNLSSEFGFGVLNGVGTLRTNVLINAYLNDLKGKGQRINSYFSFDDVQTSDDRFWYRDREYSRIVYANGVAILENKPFERLPIKPNKGEWIRVKCEKLELDGILNSSVFIKPERKSEFTVGATYDRHNLHPLTTSLRRNELLAMFEEITGLNASEVLDHQGGIRPTSPDRKPIVGEHPNLPNVYLLNGLGSRGILHAPLMAKWLVNRMLDGETINPKADVIRFKKRLMT